MEADGWGSTMPSKEDEARLAQKHWEARHATDFALLDTPEQRIDFLKELLVSLKKDIETARHRSPAVTAEDTRILAEGERYLELKYCRDREGLLARLEQESDTPELSSSENGDLMRNSRQTWQRTIEPELRFQLQTEGPELPEDEWRKIIEDKRQEYNIVQWRKALEAKQEKTKQMLELAPRYWAARDRQREDEQAWQMSHRFWADQRLLITKLDQARLDEARREEDRASAPPQPVPQEPPLPEGRQDRPQTASAKKKRGRQEYMILFWKALQDKDKELQREATSEEIWEHLKENLTKDKKYDPHEDYIQTITQYQMLVCKNNGGDNTLNRTSFSRAIKRLRANPPSKEETDLLT